MLANPDPGAASTDPFEPTAAGAHLYFRLLGEPALYASDGTAEGTGPISNGWPVELSSHQPAHLIPAGPLSFFAGQDPNHDRGLWAPPLTNAVPQNSWHLYD